MITLTIPNDDTIVLRQFGKALIEIASEKDGHPVDVTVTPLVISTDVKEPEIDTTAQQVEALSQRQQPLGEDFEKVLTENLSDLYIESEPTTDSTGTPWDERIHSASKALNADGTWRLRRKPKDMDELEWAALVESVKNELMGVDAEDLKEFEESKQAMLESVSIEPTREEVDELIEASNKMLEPPVTPPGDDFHTDADVVTEQTVAGIPPLPVPPPVVVAPPVTTWDFPRLMTFLTERHGKIDVATVNTLLAQDGMSSVQELNAHPDKIGPFVARVKAHLGE